MRSFVANVLHDRVPRGELCTNQLLYPLSIDHSSDRSVLVLNLHLSNNFLIQLLFSTFSETTASIVTSRLARTIASFAIYGWQTTNVLIIAQTADFAVSEGLKTSNTAMIAACASIAPYTTTTIARLASTSPTVLCVKNIYSHPDRPVTKCPVDTPFIGIAFDSWLLMILVVQFVKRRQKQKSV